MHDFKSHLELLQNAATKCVVVGRLGLSAPHRAPLYNAERYPGGGSRERGPLGVAPSPSVRP